MAIHPNPDRNVQYMHENWGTTRLITDYGSLENVLKTETKFKKQERLHQSIRNDVDYDDWEYGTEPSYGKEW
jgi:hypothetical protein